MAQGPGAWGLGPGARGQEPGARGPERGARGQGPVASWAHVGPGSGLGPGPRARAGPMTSGLGGRGEMHSRREARLSYKNFKRRIQSE